MDEAATREALARMSEDGLNMSLRHLFEFALVSSTETGARILATALEQATLRGVSLDIDAADDSPPTCYLEAPLVPSFSEVRRLETSLTKRAAQYDAQLDGWMALGPADAV
jgi:hypothetical protein